MRRIYAVILFFVSLFTLKAEMRADSILLQYLRTQNLRQYSFDKVDIYTNGTDKFEAMFRDFNQAKKTIDVEYFIFADDSIAYLTLDVLRQAVARGVKVRLVVDGYKDHERHYGFDGPKLDTLRNQGIETYIFDRWRRPYLWHVPRDHRKIVVVDGEIGYIGGLNIADYYINGKPDVYGGWRDTHIRITGEAVNGLADLFENAWTMAKEDKTVLGNIPIPDLPEIDGSKIVYFERSRESKQKKAETRNAFIAAFRSAQDTLRIVSPYLLPTHTVRKALIETIDRGVEVEILFSRDGDQPVLSVGNYHLSKRLIRHGAKVYLYKGAFHHSKIFTIDGQCSMVGSANLNSRSLKFDYEASCFIFDECVTNELNKIFADDKLQSDRLTEEYYRNIPRKKRLFGWFVDRFLTPWL